MGETTITKELVAKIQETVQNLYPADEIPWVIGYSGGKDSTLLLAALAAYRRFSPQKFTLEAITIDMGLKDTKNEEMDALVAYCESLNVPHHFVIKKQISGRIWKKRRTLGKNKRVIATAR